MADAKVHSHEEVWPPVDPTQRPLGLSEYRRYGRQMILSDFGLPAQLRLKKSRVLVVGAGGLGCPSVQYLAAAGVGNITVLDHDVVELSNLARQILHTDGKIGLNKATSIAQAVSSINPHVQVSPLEYALTPSNAVELISAHDLVLDCTDNPLTRYLISDAAVLAGIQVVSGAAQGYEGQVMVLHKYLPRLVSDVPTPGTSPPRGPCYRCLFPKAPLPEQVTNCEDGGVLGGITGLVGTMQAIEAIKILAKIGEATPPALTLVSPFNMTPYRIIRLRPRQISSCRACGDPRQVGESNMIRDLNNEDYTTFCGLSRQATNRVTMPSVSPKELTEVMKGSSPPSILDVRPSIETGISSLPGQHSNVPFAQLRRDPSRALAALLDSRGAGPEDAPKKVYIVCRRGNDSREAVTLLQSHKQSSAAATGEEQASGAGSPWSQTEFVDVQGGLEAYAREVDPMFPLY